MSTKIVVRMKDILEKSKPYISNKKLGAYKHQGTNCQYDYGDGCRCIVGCALSKRQLEKGLEGRSAYEILSSNIPEEERADIDDLQAAHDNWAQDGDDFKGIFFNLLKQMRKKYLKNNTKVKSVPKK